MLLSFADVFSGAAGIVEDLLGEDYYGGLWGDGSLEGQLSLASVRTVERQKSSVVSVSHAEDRDNAAASVNATTTTTKPWLTVDSKMGGGVFGPLEIGPVVGRVDCLRTPRLCAGRYPQVSAGRPAAEIAIPLGMQVRVAAGQKWQTDDEGAKSGRFAERVETSYGERAARCLWRRHGAEHLTDRCRYALMKYRKQRAWTVKAAAMQQPAGKGDEVLAEIEGCIAEGQRVALVHNALFALVCAAAVAAQCAAGRRLLARCSARFCGGGGLLLTGASARLSQEERMAQVRQKALAFYVSTLMVGCAAIFLPQALPLVAAPIAVGGLFSLWYFEFEGKCCCCRRRCGGGRSGAGFRQVQRQAQNNEGDEKRVPLLSDAA